MTAASVLLFKDDVQTKGQKFCSKIERHFGFPHDSNYTATKRKVCLGPRTNIRVTGKLFCQKIGSPICSADFFCDFFSNFGGGGACTWQPEVWDRRGLLAKTCVRFVPHCIDCLHSRRACAVATATPRIPNRSVPATCVATTCLPSGTQCRPNALP